MQLESPALCNTAETPAYEVKFLLSERESRLVQEHLPPTMAIDPYADPALGHAYCITSLYFDTPRFDVLARSDKYRRKKYRLRRYGSEPTVFLERKSKSQDEVRKKRTLVALTELPHLIAPPSEWQGEWFAAQLAKKELKPVCAVSYHRRAFMGPGPTGPIRVTFDREARGVVTDDWHPEVVVKGQPLLHDEVIMEFKYLGVMPVCFKEIIEKLRIMPQSVSKYRRCATALGFVPAGSPGNA